MDGMEISGRMANGEWRMARGFPYSPFAIPYSPPYDTPNFISLIASKF